MSILNIFHHNITQTVLLVLLLLFYNLTDQIDLGIMRHVLIFVCLTFIIVTNLETFGWFVFLKIMLIGVIFQVTSDHAMYTGPHIITLAVTIAVMVKLDLVKIYNILALLLLLSLIFSLVSADYGFGVEENFLLDFSQYLKLDPRRFRSALDGFGNFGNLCVFLILLDILIYRKMKIKLIILFILLCMSGSRSSLIALVGGLSVLVFDKETRHISLPLIIVSVILIAQQFVDTNKLISLLHRVEISDELFIPESSGQISSDIISVQPVREGVKLYHNFFLDALAASSFGTLFLIIVFAKNAWKKIALPLLQFRKTSRFDFGILSLTVASLVSGMFDVTLIVTKPLLATIIFYYCLSYHPKLNIEER